MPLYKCWGLGTSSTEQKIQSTKTVSGVVPTKNNFDMGSNTEEYTITPDSGYDALAEAKFSVPQIKDRTHLIFDQIVYGTGDSSEDPMLNPDLPITGMSFRVPQTGIVYDDDSLVVSDVVAGANDVHYTITTDEGRDADEGHIDVTPSYGKFLLDAVVTTEAKTVTPSASQQVVVPTDAHALYKVTVNAVQSETKNVTATTEQQTVTPASGKFLSSVTVKPQQHTGSKNGGTVSPGETKTIDLTAVHNIRTVEVRGQAIQLQNKSVTVDYIPYKDEYYTDYIEVTPDTGYDALSKAMIRLPMLKSTEAIRFVGWQNKYEDPNDGELGEPVEDDDESRFIEAGNESVLFSTNGGVLASSQWLTVDMLQTKAVTISSNGTSYVFPDDFKAMRAVKIITNVGESSGGSSGGSSSGGSFEEVALYTNSSPSSSQGDVTFTLSQSINNFKYLKFVYRKSTSNSGTASVIVPVSEFKQTAYSNGYAFVSLSAYMASSTAWCRPVYYKSATSIECKTPRRLARTETSGNSGYCIVTKIYGLN